MRCGLKSKHRRMRTAVTTPPATATTTFATVTTEAATLAMFSAEATTFTMLTAEATTFTMFTAITTTFAMLTAVATAFTVLSTVATTTATVLASMLTTEPTTVPALAPEPAALTTEPTPAPATSSLCGGKTVVVHGGGLAVHLSGFGDNEFSFRDRGRFARSAVVGLEVGEGGKLLMVLVRPVQLTPRSGDLSSVVNNGYANLR